MASSFANSSELNDLSTPELISFIRTRAFKKSQFDDVARILYSSKQSAHSEFLRLNLANSKAEDWCSTLESECTHLRNLLNSKEKDQADAKFEEMKRDRTAAESRCAILESECAFFQNRCADLEKKINSGPSNTGLCSTIMQLRRNLNEEKDRFKLLDQKYRGLERFNFGAKEEADKFRKMSDQLQKHAENLEKEHALLSTSFQQGEKDAQQCKRKFSELENRARKFSDENLVLQANLGKEKMTLSSREKELAILRERDQQKQEVVDRLKRECSKLEVQVLTLFDEKLELQTNLEKAKGTNLSSGDYTDQEHKNQTQDPTKLQPIPVKAENIDETYWQIGNESSNQLMIPGWRNAESVDIFAGNSAPMEEDLSNPIAMLEGPIAMLEWKGESDAIKKREEVDDPNKKIDVLYGYKRWLRYMLVMH